MPRSRSWASNQNCWLCEGKGGIAIHIKWSERRGKPLWTAHEYPSQDPHPVIPCPVCKSFAAVDEDNSPNPESKKTQEKINIWHGK